MTTNALHADALATLAATPALLRTLLAALPPGLTEAAAEGAWSPRDVVAHLILAERNGAIGRIRTIVASDDPLLQNRNEDDELAQSGARARPLADLLAEFAQLREDDVTWLRTFDDRALLRSGRHSAVGRVTAGEFLCHAAYHDCLHLAQIATMLQSHFEPHRGAMRAF
jgi:uncharacterized damage-inducible protein DinB